MNKTHKISALKELEFLFEKINYFQINNKYSVISAMKKIEVVM